MQRLHRNGCKDERCVGVFLGYGLLPHNGVVRGKRKAAVCELQPPSRRKNASQQGSEQKRNGGMDIGASKGDPNPYAATFVPTVSHEGVGPAGTSVLSEHLLAQTGCDVT